jgi:hypothetical protein
MLLHAEITFVKKVKHAVTVHKIAVNAHHQFAEVLILVLFFLPKHLNAKISI